MNELKKGLYHLSWYVPQREGPQCRIAVAEFIKTNKRGYALFRVLACTLHDSSGIIPVKYHIMWNSQTAKNKHLKKMKTLGLDHQWNNCASMDSVKKETTIKAFPPEELISCVWMPYHSPLFNEMTLI